MIRITGTAGPIALARGRRAAALAATLAAMLLLADSLSAQATVRGSVFDSLLTRAPLEGATVIVHGTTHTATTDRRGRFEIRGLAAGRYALTFFHPALDSLDVAAPIQPVVLSDSGTVEVALATPSPRGASLALCRFAADQSTAVLFGTVRRSEDGAPLVGAEASVRWFEVIIAAGGARQHERVARDSSDADGRYRLCGVPNDIALTLVATHAGQSTGPLLLELDSAGIARRELRVSTSDPAARLRPDAAPDDTVSVGRIAGTAAVRVRVTNTAGPVSNAIVGVRGTTITAVTDASGRATLAGVPAGSQSIIVRAVGLLPQHRLLALRPNATTELEMTLARSVVLLPAVAVVGQRPNALSLDIERRLRVGQGQLIDGDALRDLAAMPSAWARIPGVTVGAQVDPMPLMRGQLGARCRADVWLDGMRMTNVIGWELRGMMLNAKRVEVYNSPTRVPAEFTTISMDPCGAVIIWSR